MTLTFRRGGKLGKDRLLLGPPSNRENMGRESRSSNMSPHLVSRGARLRLLSSTTVSTTVTHLNYHMFVRRDALTHTHMRVYVLRPWLRVYVHYVYVHDAACGDNKFPHSMAA